jgi:DNA-binding NarL/FixJ family response regulator/signal transduction histidine kinase
MMKWIALTCLLLTAGTAGAAPAVRPIREAQTAAAAADFVETEISVAGVVTWSDPAAGKFFYVQDDSGGLRVTYSEGPDPAPGDKIRVSGRLERGAFSPVISAETYENLGPGKLPYPVRASGGGLLNGSFNSEYVETDGWIRDAKFTGPSTVTAVLDSGAARIVLQISRAADAKPRDLVSYHVRARGVASPVRSRGPLRQLVEVQVLVTSMAEVQRDQRGKSPWDGPPTPLAEVFQYHPGQTRGERVRVRGQVILVANGTAYLNDGAAGLAIRGENVADAHPGEWVEAIGFRDIENFLPVLSEVTISPAPAAATPVQPVARTAERLAAGLAHAGYVSVTGQLLDRMRTSKDKRRIHTILAMQYPGGVFTAELRGPATTETMELEPGCTLKLAGICVVQTDSSGDPAGFRLLVPSAADIAVVKPAPFFNTRRLLILLSFALGVLFLVSLAVLFLVRRNSRLSSEMAERRAVQGERSRLARDLHDTLEQGLTGIHLQLHAIGPSPQEASPETQERLGAVRRLVRQCHADMRHSIWNLRSEALARIDLGEALRRAARSLFPGTGTRVQFHCDRHNPRIPPLIEDNLLRIGQEALTNIHKHAAATRVDVFLRTGGDPVVLEIRDNGAGMDPASRPPGHFGLVGMEERAARIDGKLTIASRPGQGTIIRIEAPGTAATQAPFFPAMKPIRILIADDHFVVREGLRSILRREPDFEVAGEAANGEEAVRKFDELRPDLAIIDLRMPVCGGVEAIRRIRGKFPEARLLILSNSEGDEDIHAALAAGGMGYLLKHSSGDQITPAIRALVAGRTWIPPEVAGKLAARKRTESLSPRECEIVRLLVLGEANKQIGDTLGISEQTVKSHVKNILAKLQVRDRTEAVTVALRRGIVHLPEL